MVNLLRVSFLGKGGSGKTTMATSFIRYLENNNEKVLGIDADINVNLAKGLDMPSNQLVIILMIFLYTLKSK